MGGATPFLTRRDPVWVPSSCPTGRIAGRERFFACLLDFKFGRDRSRLVSGLTDSLRPVISRSFDKLGGAAQLRKHNIQKLNARQGRCFLS